MDKTELFIEKARSKHGDTYNYSETSYTNKSTKVRIGCAQHGIFLQTPNNHLSGQGCPICAAGKRAAASASRAVGASEFIRRAREAHGDRYDYSHVAYTGQMGVVVIVCPEHGEFNQAPKVHTRGHGCPRCALATKTGVFKDTSKVRARLEARYPSLRFSDFINNGRDTKITAVCSVHGEITKPLVHWNVNGCPHCGRESSAAAPKVTDHLIAINNSKRTAYEKRFLEHLAKSKDRFDASTVQYVNQKTPVELRCLEHNQLFYPTPKNMLDKNTGCSLCGDAKVSAHKYTRVDDFLARASVVHGAEYNYSRVSYAGTHEKVEIVCSKHGSFWVTPHSHITGKTGCPSCGQKSRFETELREELDNMQVLYTVRDRALLQGKEIDVYIPSAKLGVELHGLHWHCEDRVGNLHRDKWRLANDAGIRLIQIFSDEWEQQRSIVLSKIKALLGLSDKLGARECSVVRPEFAAVRGFLATHHIQGAGAPHKTAYGLEYNGSLVAVMTFGKARTGAMTKTSGAQELLRYAGAKTVQGGFTRLLAAFRAEYPTDTVVSYCDLRWGDGRTYKQAGWRLAGITEPDYWWLPSNNSRSRVSRYATQKHKLQKHPILGSFYTPDRTELEICALAGWRKILGVGQQRWILDGESKL